MNKDTLNEIETCIRVMFNDRRAFCTPIVLFKLLYFVRDLAKSVSSRIHLRHSFKLLFLR